MGEPPGPAGRRWLQAAGLVAAAVLVAWVVRDLNGRAFLAALEQARFSLLALAAAVNLLALAVQAWRWQRLLKPIGAIAYATSLGAMFVGFTLSSLLPARVGEVARVQIVARRMRVTVAAVAGTTVLDHVVNGVTLVPVALIVPFFEGVPLWMRKGLLLVLGVTLVAGVLAWWAAAPDRERVSRRGLDRLIVELRSGFAASRSPAEITRACAIGGLAWVLEAGTAWLTLAAFGVHLGPAAAVILLIAVNLAVAIPATPANLGTFEVAAMLALTALDVPRERAIACALGYHALQLVPVWLAGAVAWLRMREWGADLALRQNSTRRRSHPA